MQKGYYNKGYLIERITFENGKIKEYINHVYATLLEGLNQNKIILHQRLACGGGDCTRVVGELILDKEYNILECYTCKDDDLNGEIIIS